MFKNALVYRIEHWAQPPLSEIEGRLQGARFVECGASQPESLGCDDAAVAFTPCTAAARCRAAARYRPDPRTGREGRSQAVLETLGQCLEAVPQHAQRQQRRAQVLAAREGDVWHLGEQVETPAFLAADGFAQQARGQVGGVEPMA